MEKVVVTGGAGFIGSHIVEELIKQDYNVTIVDNLVEGKLENISKFKDKIKFVKGDIRDYELLKKEFKGADFISHQAALRSVPKSLITPQDYNDVNIQGHFNVLKAAKENNVKCVVFASSSSVYGDNSNLPLKEDYKPRPISPYAITKTVGEYYCGLFNKIYDLNVVSLRYFNVFGPRQDPHSQYACAIPSFIKKILNNEPPLIYGDGQQSRDFTYVKNIVNANLLAFKAKNIGGEIINIANKNAITVNNLIKMINNILGKNVRAIYTEKRPGDILYTLGDNEKAKKLLGYKQIGFEEGLKETVKWFKNHPNI